MKGKVVAFKDRAEMCTFLQQLREDECRLDQDIAELKRLLQKDYWGVKDRETIFLIVSARARFLEKYPRLRGKKK